MKKLILIPSLTLLASTPLITLSGCDLIPQPDEVYDVLVKLPNVVKVKRVHVDFTNRKVYDLWFSQPLNWEDAESERFNQRVRFSFAGFDAINEMFISGYELQDLTPDHYNDLEVAAHYNANTIRPEYRFYGDSCPEGLNPYSLKHWNNLTVDNAAKDFKDIIRSFKTAFSGKWIMSGSGKGGFTTNFQAGPYAATANIYISYCAPQANDRNISAMYNATFNDHSSFLTTQQYDKNLADFIWYGIHNKNNIVNKYFWPDISNMMMTENADFTEYFISNINKAYEVCVGEAGVGFWQYEEDINQLIEFNEMENGEAKEKRFYEILSELSNPRVFNIRNRNNYAYSLQAYRQTGDHKIAFNPMIEYVNKYGSVKDISRSNFETKEADEDDLWWNLSLLQIHIQKYEEFDWLPQSELALWYSASQQKGIFMIYGSCDPWTSMSLSKLASNPSEFIAENEYFGQDLNNPYCRSHRARITELEQNKKEEIWKKLDNLLDK